MKNINLRSGVPQDAEHFKVLAVYTAPHFIPALFAPDHDRVLKQMFFSTGNMFSHRHAQFIEVDGRVAGMLLGYSGKVKKKEITGTAIALLKIWGPSFFLRLYRLLKSQKVVGNATAHEFYISNVATYPEFRSMGLGRRLIAEAERKAISSGCRRISLDVETDNEKARSLYERLGLSIVKQTPPLKIGDKSFEFFRMSKPL